MKAKRRRYDSAFKARVGLEALKAQKTTQQIAGEYEVHPTQVSEWKRTLSEGLGAAFEKGKGIVGEEFERERERLHSQIGELVVGGGERFLAGVPKLFWPSPYDAQR